MKTTDDLVLCRSVKVADVDLRDGELDALFVPWDSPTKVYDEPEPYEEGFRRGTFAAQLAHRSFSPAAVPLLPRHGSTDQLGYGRQLREDARGLRGTMRVHQSRRDDLQQMVDDGIDSVSIEFHPLQKRPRTRDGVRWRTMAVLMAVAMTPVPAYTDAKVLALREEDVLSQQQRAARLEALQADIDSMTEGGTQWRP